MKQIGFFFLKALLGCYLLLSLCSNVAQPGVWNAGGGGFNFLYPEDSVSFRKIRMENERIAIQLYPGFAVVQGRYQMRNTSSDTVRIKVGYPVNGVYQGGWSTMNEVQFDSLHQLQVFQNGKNLRILEKPLEQEHGRAQTYQNDNWYVWESVFEPDAVTELKVNFLVNTNNAFIRQGYGGDDHNAFIYILESGSVWKQPIGQAEFRLQLMDGLEVKAIHGISRTIDFRYATSERLLFGKRTAFSPTERDNLVINYGRQLKELDFAAKSRESARYFQAVERLAAMDVDQLAFQDYPEEDPYQVRSADAVTLFFVLAVIVLPALFLAALIYLLFRIFRRR